MSRKYKVRDNTRLHFVTFATVYWIDIFTRAEYKNIVLDSLLYCQKNKGLDIYAWCIMTNHVHLIIGTESSLPLHGIIRDFKAFTSRRLREAIEENPQESRKKWLQWIMTNAGRRNSNNDSWQLWQQDYHPIELFTYPVIKQKLDYIHQNPVEAGFVFQSEDWQYSSAGDYAGLKGFLDIILVDE